MKLQLVSGLAGAVLLLVIIFVLKAVWARLRGGTGAPAAAQSPALPPPAPNASSPVVPGTEQTLIDPPKRP